MSAARLRIAFLGLSITSSWGNGHATTWRSLVRALHERGHDVTFLERDVPWYAAHRDLPEPPWGRTVLYRDRDDLEARGAAWVREADLVVLGSYVPEGVRIADWIFSRARGATAFYDIDTPVTLGKLAGGDEEYLAARQVPRFDLYLSFTGGPTLARLEHDWGARRARALYCSVDPQLYFPEESPARWDLAYLGTFSEDRQPAIERLLIEPARRLPAWRFVVAGPQYPAHIVWPPNVERIAHVPAAVHRPFYSEQRFALNATRARMVDAGWSPSVRLFEAAACGVPIVSDPWAGLEAFFTPGEEILIAHDADDVVRALHDLDDDERRRIGAGARRRVLAAHTAARRAAELEGYLAELGSCTPSPDADAARSAPAAAGAPGTRTPAS